MGSIVVIYFLNYCDTCFIFGRFEVDLFYWILQRRKSRSRIRCEVQFILKLGKDVSFAIDRLLECDIFKT